MYCPNCGTPRTKELSFCNRCGADLRERKEPVNTAAISAILTAITTLGVAGLAIMLGGAVILRKKAGLDQELIGVFMMFTFLIVAVTEFMLVRNLSKLTSSSEAPKYFPPAAPMNEMRLPPAGNLGEPVPSVTENTTRTLDYVRREQ
ncbi:MAG TPA: zinc ribbon domain-containing protein [Pyrinomonadaceae bacterium]|nr:zinc ribbon domain-containing protein [Pyrinomonadaceae bacterium]